MIIKTSIISLALSMCVGGSGVVWSYATLSERVAQARTQLVALQADVSQLRSQSGSIDVKLARIEAILASERTK